MPTKTKTKNDLIKEIFSASSEIQKLNDFDSVHEIMDHMAHHKLIIESSEGHYRISPAVHNEEMRDLLGELAEVANERISYLRFNPADTV